MSNRSYLQDEPATYQNEHKVNLKDYINDPATSSSQGFVCTSRMVPRAYVYNQCLKGQGGSLLVQWKHRIARIGQLCMRNKTQIPVELCVLPA